MGHPTPKQIAKCLGLTEHSLRHLMKAARHEDGRAHGEGFGHGSGAARGVLEKKGLIEYRPVPFNGGCGTFDAAFINDAGRDMAQQARRLGW